jgi:hypothetical protein
MIYPTSVEPREKYRIWLRYSDGADGEIDLSDVAGRGIFKAWDEPGYFEKVCITPHGSVAWGDEIELCPESLYIELTGKSVGEVMPGTRPMVQSA